MTSQSKLIVTVSLKGGQVYRHEIDLPGDPNRVIAAISLWGEIIGRSMDGKLETLPLLNPFAVYRSAHISSVAVDVADVPSGEQTLRKAMGFQIHKQTEELLADRS